MGKFSRRKAGTHWLIVGRDTGGRTSGIAVNARASNRWTYRQYCVNAGARTLTHERVPSARATNPRTGGRPTQEPSGTIPSTGQVPRYFKILTFPSRSFVLGPTASRWSLAWYAVHHPQVPLCGVLVFVLSVSVGFLSRRSPVAVRPRSRVQGRLIGLRSAEDMSSALSCAGCVRLALPWYQCWVGARTI